SLWPSCRLTYVWARRPAATRERMPELARARDDGDPLSRHCRQGWRSRPACVPQPEGADSGLSNGGRSPVSGDWQPGTRVVLFHTFLAAAEMTMVCPLVHLTRRRLH